MKIKLNYFFTLLCLFLTFTLVSCSTKDDSKKDNQIYSINCEKSDYYKCEGTTSSTSGQTATIQLTSNFPAYEIIGCTYNDNECTKDSESENSKIFIFSMPACNVNIKVLSRWNDLSISGYNNFLSFDSNNTYIAKTAINDENYNNDENWGTPLIIAFQTDVRYMTIADITCMSTNEDILPNSAISIKKTLSSNSNEIFGGKVIINRSMVKTGTTQIVLRVKNENNLTYDAIIVATINITE